MHKLCLLLLTSLFFLALPAFGQSGGSTDRDSALIRKLDSLALNMPDIFDRAEVMPEFPGGSSAMMKFLASNIKYPEVARKNKTEGKVIIKFYIDLDGSVRNPMIMKDMTNGQDGLAEEALRVVNAMPKWAPGRQRGKDVKVYFVLPITFKLS